jgi:UDP-N-acetyl-D-mannosaminuronic acid dehydrogenase
MDEAGLHTLSRVYRQTLYDICVVGLGYVGLPTACAFASRGFRTVGVDIKREIVDGINRGQSPLGEADIVKCVKEAVSQGYLSATIDLRRAVAESKAVIIAVQTPLENGKVRLKYLTRACRSVAAAIKSGALVIVVSTVPPGTTAKMIRPIFEQRGFDDGDSFFLAYCPERIAPGNSMSEFLNNDRIVGFDNGKSGDMALQLLKRVTNSNLYSTDTVTAETVKLVENTARDVYIAFANEVSKICTKIGVDTWDVIRLANTHPRVRILRPGPGVGGPCLSKDPYMLLQSYRDAKLSKKSIIRYARIINENMYQDVMKLIRFGLAQVSSNRKIAVLGTAYKPEVGDPRSSPSEKVISELIHDGFDVWAYDPYCKETFGAREARDLIEAVKGASCCVFMVAHRVFSEVSITQLGRFMEEQPVVVDAVGILPVGEELKGNIRIIRLGGISAHGIC